MEASNDDTDTELTLTPGGRSSRSRNRGGDGRPGMSASGALAAAAGGELQQKISVFYGGQVCICDVTEIQARAIICMANREMEETMKSSGQSASALSNSWPEPPAAPDPQLLNSRLSMARSLQSFLQKRKTRACKSTSPYPMQKQQNPQSDSSSSS